MILKPIGIGAERTEESGAYNERSGCQPEEAFGTAPPPPRLDAFDTAGAFELAQVVVDLLPGETEATRQAGRRIGAGQGLENAAAQIGKDRGDAVGLVENGDRCLGGSCLHDGGKIQLKNRFVN